MRFPPPSKNNKGNKMAAKTKTDSIKEVLRKAKFVDFRFTDTLGQLHHFSLPSSEVNHESLTKGKPFDGSSIAGWKGIEAADMLLMPNPDTLVMDPFPAEPTAIIICHIVDPVSGQPYGRCPRSIGHRAIHYAKSTGIADDAVFGPEPEFFVFDSVQYRDEPDGAMYQLHTSESTWASSAEGDKLPEGFNSGHRPALKGGYLPSPPVDSLNDLRGEICLKMEEMGLQPLMHHHEVGGSGQCEIGYACASLLRCADNTQLFKYAVRNVAHQQGQTATFMPKPVRNDNGSGMHVHQSISKNGKPVFVGNAYSGLSQTALYYIGGILKHGRALNAFTNPATNSYKRLLPGFEAPTRLAYAARNRSVAVRVPHVVNPKAARIEVRFPDPMCNPYLGFSAMLMAGLDGIKNKIDPGKPHDFNLYTLRRGHEDKRVKAPEMCASLPEALQALDKDREFLKAGGVFEDDVIDAYIQLKQEEVDELRAAPHPAEFRMYYSW